MTVALVATAGCGVSAQSHPTVLDNRGVSVVTPASTTSLPVGTPTRHVDLCLVAGDRLRRRTAELPIPLTTRGALQALVAISKTDLPAGVRSAIDNPRLVTAAETTRGVARVELNREFGEIAPADQILALAQVVCTLTSLPGIGQVEFTQRGRPIDVPRGDSSLTNRPVSRADYRQFLPRS